MRPRRLGSAPSLGGWLLTIPQGVGSSEQVSLRPPPRLTWPGVGEGAGSEVRSVRGACGCPGAPGPTPQRHSSTTSAESKSFRSSDGSSAVVSEFSASDTEDTCRTQSLSLSGFG